MHESMYTVCIPLQDRKVPINTLGIPRRGMLTEYKLIWAQGIAIV